MKHTIATAVFFIVLSLGGPPRAAAQTTCGTLTASESWTGTITVTCPVTVPSGLTLTIAPGSVVIFAEGNPNGTLTIGAGGTLKIDSNTNSPTTTFATRSISSPNAGWNVLTINYGLVTNNKLLRMRFWRSGLVIKNYGSAGPTLSLEQIDILGASTNASVRLDITSSNVSAKRLRIENGGGIRALNLVGDTTFSIDRSELIDTLLYVAAPKTTVTNNLVVFRVGGPTLSYDVGFLILSGNARILFNTVVNLRPTNMTTGMSLTDGWFAQGNLIHGFSNGFNASGSTYQISYNNVSRSSLQTECPYKLSGSCTPPDATNTTELIQDNQLRMTIHPTRTHLLIDPSAFIYRAEFQVPTQNADPSITTGLFGLPRVGGLTLGATEFPVIVANTSPFQPVTPNSVRQNNKTAKLVILGQNFDPLGMSLSIYKRGIDNDEFFDSDISVTNVKIVSNTEIEATLNVHNAAEVGERRIFLWNPRSDVNPANFSYGGEQLWDMQKGVIHFYVVANTAPAFDTSTLQSPPNGGESRNGEVTFSNAIDSTPVTGQTTTYTCRFAKNLGMTDGLVEVTNVPQGTGGFTTCKAPDGTLTDNTVYYVQFVAYDGTGPELYSESGVYSFFYNTVDEGPTVPALKTPQDGAKVPTTTPTLTIGNSSDPDSQTRTYQIQIATDKDFNSIVVDKAGIAEDPSGETKLVVASGVLNEDTTYYWRARALDTDDSLYSEWSAGISFTINTNNTIPAAPALDVPQDGVEVGTNTPNLTVVNSFDPEGDPLTYTFVIDTVNTLNSGNKQEKTVSENAGGKTFWTPSALEENTVYYWQVCVDDGSKSPNCTPIYSFKVNAQNEKPTIPQVKSPTNLSTVTNLRPDLVVSNSSDADGDTVQYHFQLSTSSDFSTTIIDNMSVPQGSGADTTLKLLADLSEDTRYFWRVEALDEHGLSSGWTSTQQFFVSVNNDLPAIPKLLSPQNEITINTPTPTLTAENVTDPEGNALVYEFEIDTDPGFSGVEYQRKEVPKSGGAQTTFTPATLKENLTYYWRVRVSDGSGTTGWSEVWSFTVDVDNQPPTNPVATSPDNGQVLTVFEVALNIENSSDPEGDAFDYIVQFYRDEALSQKLGGDLYVKPQAGTKTIFTYGTNGELQKLGAGDFYWRVQAVDKKGGKSGWSNIAHFVINDGSNPGDDVTNPTDDVTNPTNDTSTPTDDSVTPTDDGVTPDSGDPNNPDSTTGVDAGSTSKGGGGCTLSRSATTSPSTMLVLAFLLLGLALRRRYQG